MIRAFFNKWTEKNDGAKKMRYEMERTFEIPKRLATWKNNEQVFKKSNSKNQENEPTKIRMGKREAEALGLIPKQDDPNA